MATTNSPRFPEQEGQNRGICSLSHGGRTLRFRTNPNSIKWNYQLHTKIDDTSGGRVIQLLGTRMGDLEVTAEAGNGGWPYLVMVAKFFRDLMNDQRKGKPAVFEYTTRNYKFNVFATGIPFTDNVTAVSKEFTMSFKIQEDISGVASSNSLRAELARLQEGVGFQRSNYNAPDGYLGSFDSGTNVMQNNLVKTATGVAQDVITSIGNSILSNPF